jgi:hypothetical protein
LVAASLQLSVFAGKSQELVTGYFDALNMASTGQGRGLPSTGNLRSKQMSKQEEIIAKKKAEIAAKLASGNSGDRSSGSVEQYHTLGSLPPKKTSQFTGAKNRW